MTKKDVIKIFEDKKIRTVWDDKRLKSIEICKTLTDEWKARGLEGDVHFATLTDIITKNMVGKHNERI